ncbi:hypothetical protein QN277_023663 [Acacia crassicarpa]|uniref:Uncharacterized protein n=1 Tax=Acacia crassicarpa TaxID=499986 RepID=A0AAE1JEY5_9FABA|nr:hypothetical protein QN277_023663 [Acacia crassicarpa]
MARHVPKLKVISVQSVRVNKNALVYVVKKLKELEVLDVSHALIVCGNRGPDFIEVCPQSSLPILLANMPRKPTTLMYCKTFCNKCDEVLICNMMPDWRDPKEQIWREDEISSLRV